MSLENPECVQRLLLYFYFLWKCQIYSTHKYICTHSIQQEVNCLIRGQINATCKILSKRNAVNACWWVGRSRVVQNTGVRFVPNFTRLSLYRHFGQAPTTQFIAISLFSSLHNTRRFYYLEKSIEICETYFSFIFITYKNQIWINSMNTMNIRTE